MGEEKSPEVVFSTWSLNSRNCSENYTKTKTKKNLAASVHREFNPLVAYNVTQPASNSKAWYSITILQLDVLVCFNNIYLHKKI